MLGDVGALVLVRRVREHVHRHRTHEAGGAFRRRRTWFESRLGMGGGYYDRYFSSAEQRPWIVGIAFDIQHSEKPLPTEPWDITLDAVVTETGFRIFND